MTTATLYSVIAVLAAYAIGSLSFAVLVSRAMGLSDPRTYGSNNPGATNVLRSGNRKAAVTTLLLDALKGYLPVLLTVVYGPRIGLGDTTVALVGLAAFIGHVWPVFFRFKGGKGVATAAGVLLAFDPMLGLAVLATWVVMAVVFRYSSLAALVAAVAAPFYQLLMSGTGPVLLAVVVMSLVLLWRHQANIAKLLAGTESRLGSKKGAATVPAPGMRGGRHGRPASAVVGGQTRPSPQPRDATGQRGARRSPQEPRVNGETAAQGQRKAQKTGQAGGDGKPGLSGMSAAAGPRKGPRRSSQPSRKSRSR
ncbi:MAG: glycerol-3-phosphate acyltransferase [Rhizobacter sp.]|nr:glycerol-3-phosphate acyltransferase [Rhizobacter sp.]